MAFPHRIFFEKVPGSINAPHRLIGPCSKEHRLLSVFGVLAEFAGSFQGILIDHMGGFLSHGTPMTLDGFFHGRSHK